MLFHLGEAKLHTLLPKCDLVIKNQIYYTKITLFYIIVQSKVYYNLTIFILSEKIIIYETF
ncbi:hypothetical protein A1D29_11010 [Pasteurellaceae bacterium Orientalotternb1]|nr:hypothetical protein A1D29_11010 [Pasteurellaceae bacterium Orientalotternb1]